MQTDHPARLEWQAQALQDELARLCPGLVVQVLASVDSTNTLLMERCRAAGSSPPAAALVVAEEQRRGRGRQGRAWHSTRASSLTFSLAWPLQTQDLSGLSLAVGVALAEVLDDAPDMPRIALKWPNDLWLLDARLGGDGSTDVNPAGRKLGGILIETVNHGPQRTAVIGVGLNVLPQTVAEARAGVACLQEVWAGASAPLTLHRVAAPLVQTLHAFEAEGFPAFMPRYRQRDLLLGRTVQAGTLSGICAGVAANGALLLQDELGLHSVVSGEVSIRMLAPSRGAAPQDAC